MDIVLLRAFQIQVRLQCQFLLLAADEANDALGQNDITRLFYAIQNMLNAAANISKAFWGAGGRLAAKRKPLRDSIGVLKLSQLQQVGMRNNFEHFDDRLDCWWEKSKRHNYADLNVGPRNAISGLEGIDMFRMYDPKASEIVFWSETFNLQALVHEVESILSRVTVEERKSCLCPRSKADAHDMTSIHRPVMEPQEGKKFR